MIGGRGHGAGLETVLPGRAEALYLLPWLGGLLAYVAALGAVGFLVVADVQRGWERSLGGALTLELPADTSQARLDTVLALVNQTVGIASARRLERADMAGLLQPWLGAGAPIDELHLPVLLDLRLDPAAPPDLDGLRRHLASIAPEAALDDYGPALSGVRPAARRLDAVFAAAVLLGLASLAGLYGFATASAIGGQSDAVELVSLLGADDRDIARPFALRGLWSGLAAGAIGAAALLLTILALRGAGVILQLPDGAAAVAFADWRVWAILAGVVALCGAAATGGALVAVLRRLAQRP